MMPNEHIETVICAQCNGKGEIRAFARGMRRCPTCGGFGTLPVFKKPADQQASGND